MKATLQITLMSAVLFLFSACASTYKPLRPETLEYSRTFSEGNLDSQYRYNILLESGNKKYAKDERKKNIQLVAVKLKNNGDEPITYDQLQFISNGRVVSPLPTQLVSQKIRQGVVIYALYALIYGEFSTTTTENGYVTSHNQIMPALPWGLPIAVGNIIVAAKGNANFKDELYQYDLHGKVIQPGETVHALVGFRNLGYGSLEVIVDKVERVL